MSSNHLFLFYLPVLFTWQFQTAFDHEEAKKQGCIVPKKGVDAEYDSVLAELEENKKDLDKYLAKQRNHFAVKITFYGTDKKRYQIEVPESQVKKVGPGYELQSQRKGFKRYYTAEAKVIIIITIIVIYTCNLKKNLFFFSR